MLFAPVHRRWLRLVRGRASLAAILSVLTVVLVGLVPVAFVTVSVVREALGGYARVSAGGIEHLAPVEWFETQTPRINAILGDVGIDLAEVRTKVSSAVVTVSRSIASWGLDLGRNLARFIALSFVMLYVAFFFFRDGKTITDRVVRAIPLGKGREALKLARHHVVEVHRYTENGPIPTAATSETSGAATAVASSTRRPSARSPPTQGSVPSGKPPSRSGASAHERSSRREAADRSTPGPCAIASSRSKPTRRPRRAESPSTHRDPDAGIHDAVALARLEGEDGVEVDLGDLGNPFHEA